MWGSKGPQRANAVKCAAGASVDTFVSLRLPFKNKDLIVISYVALKKDRELWGAAVHLQMSPFSSLQPSLLWGRW